MKKDKLIVIRPPNKLQLNNHSVSGEARAWEDKLPDYITCVLINENPTDKTIFEVIQL